MKGEFNSTDERWWALVGAADRMSTATTVEAVIDVLRETARAVVGSPGIAVVLREGSFCHYAAEDSAEPLWTGQRFAAETCVSGWAMIRNETAVIPDIRKDARVPQEAYQATFVRSMVMVPIGQPEAVAAIGAYWGEPREHNAEDTRRLEALARFAATGLEAARRRMELQALADTLELRVEERSRELTETREALRQSQKLESIGELTGGLAHDFNNLLTPIMGGLDMLKRSGSVTGERQTRWIDNAMQSAERARVLVQRMLAFARRQPLKPTAVDVPALLDSLKDLIRTTLGHRADLSIEAAADLPRATADVNQLESALLNLAINARDAMPAGGLLTITARQEVIGDGHASLSPGRYVRLSIADNGEGMDEETAERAIEPFFSTKGVGKGTGLGLSMVHGLANQLGGAMSIDSAPGRGTTIELWLPVSEAQPVASAQKTASVGSAFKGAGMALVVDDEDMVRSNTVDMLEDLGFEVAQANSADDALEMLASDRPFRVMLTDHLIPGTSGGELAQKAAEIRPEMRILMTSGHFADSGGDASENRLKKPFRRAELEASLQSLLG